jgi:hypothetical protein
MATRVAVAVDHLAIYRRLEAQEKTAPALAGAGEESDDSLGED